jgi:hypothetical protein
MDSNEYLTESEARYAIAAAHRERLYADYQRDREERERRFLTEDAEALAEMRALEHLIELERRRGGARETPPAPPPRQAPAQDLADFFVARLAEQSPQHRDDLRKAAEEAGYFDDGESAAGRRTHATLMNTARAGRIRDLGAGLYASPTTLMNWLRPVEGDPAADAAPGFKEMLSDLT